VFTHCLVASQFLKLVVLDDYNTHYATHHTREDGWLMPCVWCWMYSGCHCTCKLPRACTM